jgi:hydroxymethylpyrimidine pyrophosphatase-like HAD family hydrolase
MPPTRCIAVDVDGTLHSQGRPNQALIDWCRERRAAGIEMVLWSARGREHAQRAAEAFGCVDAFDSIVSKPGCIVDDMGWASIRNTTVLAPDLEAW